MPTDLGDARTAVAEQRWADGYALLRAAGPGTLEAPDLERLAVCAYLLGEDDACAETWRAAHEAAKAAGDLAEAARFAFWAGLCAILRGQVGPAGGWLARTERIIEEASLDCVAAGYLLVPAFLGALDEGDAARAAALAHETVEVADRFDDADLRAFGTVGHGQALIAGGDLRAGTRRLDEVMLAVTGGEVGPITSGIVYCAVILECVGVFDLRRAREWTLALAGWCDAQPDLVPYRGQCLVHRSQVQQAAGDWPSACSTVAAARRRLADPPHPALGLACYQQAELHRLTGALDEAEAAYREASRHGHQPLPGLALLALGRGDVDGAVTMIRRALQDAASAMVRPALLAAAVEILVAAGDQEGAAAAAEELRDLAERSPAEVLGAMAARATAEVLLAEGTPAAALVELRRAAATCRALDLPYDGARVAVLAGEACAAMGDATSATLEWDNARAAFTALGATVDRARLDRRAGGRGEGALSPREREVLGHVAAGLTNPQIAEALGISQHTVGRHLENIFVKLGVSSRAAATAHAYEHGLL